MIPETQLFHDYIAVGTIVLQKKRRIYIFFFGGKWGRKSSCSIYLKGIFHVEENEKWERKMFSFILGLWFCINFAWKFLHFWLKSLSSSVNTSELHGIDRTILMRALRLLEQKGKLAIFKGTSADDEGVKFSM
jgi:hypothetical protein